MIHTGEIGTIEYRLPTIPEVLELWGKVGIDHTSATQADSPVGNPFLMMSKIIANMGVLITKVDCQIDGVKITTYEELCKHLPAMNDLCVVAGRIMESMNGGSEAKKKQ